MLSINKYTLITHTNSNHKIVVAEFTMKSPCCEATLVPFGRRQRKYKDSISNSHTLIIRRLRCEKCKKIHHELPDILVPYKRYNAETIQHIIDTENIVDINALCDITTIFRIKRWFLNKAVLFLLLLQMRRSLKPLPNDRPINSVAEYRQGKKWLPKVVWELANHHLYSQPVLPCRSP
jgi:hypothetical protein